MELNHLPAIRVTFPDYFPYINKCAFTSNFSTSYNKFGCPYPGVMVEIIKIITDALGYKLKIMVVDEDSFNYANLTGMLEADVTDTFGIPLQNSSRYDDVVEVSEKLYDVDSYIMIHAAGGIAKDWWNIIRIYDSYSWIFILTVFFIECFCALVIYRTEKVVGFTTRKKDLDVIWQVICVQLLQATNWSFNLSSGKFLVVLFALLQGTILFGIFTSWFLLSIIKEPSYKELTAYQYIFSELEAGNRRLVSEGSQRWLEDRMADSVEFPFLQLKSALKKHPLIEGLYPDEVIDKVLYENAVMYGQADFRGYFDALAHCDILHSNIVFPLIGTHLLFPKNFSLMPQINKIILDNQFKFKNINIRYSKLVSPTSCEKFRPGDPLRINFYIGPLIVCSIVFFVAFVTLIIEFCFKWFCDFRKQDLHKLYNVTVWVNK